MRASTALLDALQPASHMSEMKACYSGVLLVNERNAPPVADEPHSEVHCWRLLQLPSGARHLMTLRNGGIARVTSAIVAIDFEQRTITTESGRVYTVMGPPEVDALKCRVLEAAAAGVLGTHCAIDVSATTWLWMSLDCDRFP